MENQDKNKNFKAPDNEGYDINQPQNLTKPAFNSSSEGRKTTTAPSIENLNQQNDDNDQLMHHKAINSRNTGTVNDESLHGNDQKTNLGNGEDRDDKEDEKLIRK